MRKRSIVGATFACKKSGEFFGGWIDENWDPPSNNGVVDDLFWEQASEDLFVSSVFFS